MKDHGKNYTAMSRSHSSPVFRWVHDTVGTNWRMTEMQSAVGRVLLRRVPEMLAKRRGFADMLNRRFSKIPALRVTIPSPEFGHANYKYYVFLRPQRLHGEWTQRSILQAIQAEGIPCFAGSCSEIYLEKVFERLRPVTRLPVARELGETSVMLMIHPTLCEQDILDTCAAVEKVMEVASRL